MVAYKEYLNTRKLRICFTKFVKELGLIDTAWHRESWWELKFFITFFVFVYFVYMLNILYENKRIKQAKVWRLLTISFPTMNIYIFYPALLAYISYDTGKNHTFTTRYCGEADVDGSCIP